MASPCARRRSTPRRAACSTRWSNNSPAGPRPRRRRWGSASPSEKQAHAVYLTLINDFADAPLATDARFELAELYGQRHDYDAAIKLLNDGLDKEPPPDLTEKIRLRLGICHAAKGNHKAALAQF